ncbi:hypothetical protein SK128_014118 [Halocaridina rubra]|uniref:Uncharacterized protein n=1 Tax=Halocaridina rubra TaxID=373956 RepID=A0AAN8XP39_HALRR
MIDLAVKAKHFHGQGTTLVVVRMSNRRCTQLTVHGPAASLKKLLPGTPCSTIHSTYPLLDSRASPVNVNTSPLLAGLQEHGYHPTVKSSWVESESGALITQWIVYNRRGGPKPLTLSSPYLQTSTSSFNLSTLPSVDDEEDTTSHGTLPNKLRSRSKSIFSLATEHTPIRPTLTLKRILSVLL